MLRMLDHPNITELYEIFESGKYIHLVLPLLAGGELFDSIKAKGLYKESDAVRVMHQFLSALAYMHDLNIVHRDLKPENLLLTKKFSNEIKIADFGLAHILKDPSEKLSLACGSPGYVAPEVLKELGYGTASDVFSAGVIFYVMLTGRPVFRGSD